MSDNELADLEKLDLPFDIHSVRQQCVDCVRKQLEKYKNHMDVKKKSTKGRFLVKCAGIPINYLDPKYRDMLSEEDWNMALASVDVVLWAEKNITHPDGTPWVARDYQETVLHCSSKRKALRIARRCLAPGTPILMADGRWKEIEKIKVGEIVASRNKKNQLVGKKVISEYDNGVQDIYEIMLSNGMCILCTPNEPLLAFEKISDGQRIRKTWKSIDEGLSVGTKVVVAKHYDKWGKIHNPDLCALLGYMLTDGYFGSYRQTPKFTNVNMAMINEVAGLSNRLFGYKCTTRVKGNGYDLHITDGCRSSRNKFVSVLENLELRDIKAKRKYIPECLFEYDKESQMILVNRMFSGDGGVSISNRGKEHSSGEIFLVSSAKQILKQVQLLLRKIGVESYITKDERDLNIFNRGKFIHSVCYKLRISRATSVENFFDHVGLIYGKEEVSKELLAINKQKAKRRRKGSIQFRYETIKSIVYKGKSSTYDIEVKDHHNFIADGIVCHNSGKTDLVSIEITHQLFTKENIRILVTGPLKIHVEEIINRIRGFVRRNPTLATAVVRDVSSPLYEIELSNGSRVRGFPIGARGKTEGLAVRGQNADRIYCDELDRADDKAVIGGLLPILQTTPDTAMVGFSTPTGFKSIYYSMCVDDPYYKEFHYDYKVLPHWLEVEKDRGSYTEEEWEREFLAEFGAAEEGIYKPSYIDRSLRGYEYREISPAYGWRYIIGADWNEKHGAELVVIGENISGGYYQVVEGIGIGKMEFTQLSSVNALIQLYKKWNPAYMYVDVGAGSTNIELLRKMSQTNRRNASGDPALARIIDVLKAYDSGASILTRDPVTGMEKKVPAKPYMVNASVRMFESDKVRISSADKILEKALRNYVIKNISPTGRPVYEMRDKKVLDHRLDAFHLAMVGFFIEFGGLQPIIGGIKPVATVNPVTKRSGSSRQQGVFAKRPENRSLDSDPEGQSVLKSLYGATSPARTESHGVSSNRPGWAEDREEFYEERYLQRRARRRKVWDRNTIRRTNI